MISSGTKFNIVNSELFWEDAFSSFSGLGDGLKAGCVRVARQQKRFNGKLRQHGLHSAVLGVIQWQSSNVRVLDSRR